MGREQETTAPIASANSWAISMFSSSSMPRPTPTSFSAAEMSTAPASISDCASGTEHQDPPARELDTEIYSEVAHQAHTVGVVAEVVVDAVQHHGVDRAGALGRRGVFIHQRPGLLLERYGDIDTSAFAQKVAHAADEVVERRQQLAVLQLLTGLLGEHGMDQRRLAVLDRVADNGVTVHQASPASQSRGER